MIYDKGLYYLIFALAWGLSVSCIFSPIYILLKLTFQNFFSIAYLRQFLKVQAGFFFSPCEAPDPSCVNFSTTSLVWYALTSYVTLRRLVCFIKSCETLKAHRWTALILLCDF